MKAKSGSSAIVFAVALITAGQVHAQTTDPRDARIEALQKQIEALADQVHALQADRAQPPASAPAQGDRSGGGLQNGTTSAASIAAATTSPSSPDIPRPAGTGGVPALSSFLDGKPVFATSDGRFVANLHGVLQFDAAHYFQPSAGPTTTDLRRGGAASDTSRARNLQDGTNFRRARLGIDGKLFSDFEYNLLFEFGGSGGEDAAHIQELWLQYSGLKPLHLKIGAFRPQMGLEDQNSTNGYPFLERPDIVDTATSLAGGDFREGAQLWAASKRWLVSGAITTRVVNVVSAAATANPQSFDQSLNGVGRGVIIPFEGKNWLTHLGVHGSYAFQAQDAGGPDTAAGTNRFPIQFRERPELRVDGTRLVDTGAIDASHASTVGGEVAGQYKSFYAEAEYERIQIERRFSHDDPTFSGYYVEGSWLLTGERRKYNRSTFSFDGPPVTHPFDWKDGTWGAFELALRYSDLDLNYHQGGEGTALPLGGVRGGEQQISTAGLNWFLNPVIRFTFDYQHISVSRLSPNATTYLTPVGAHIGQTYDALAIRSQLAF